MAAPEVRTRAEPRDEDVPVPGWVRAPEARTLRSQATRFLVAEIVRGHYRAGDELPAESRMAEELGVSRQVVREAVRELSALRLVVSRQGKASKVAPHQSWNQLAPQVLRARAEAGLIDGFLLDLLELRRMVEIGAAELAAVRAEAADLEPMREALAGLERAVEDDDRATFIRLDLDFHEGALRATGNQVLPQLFYQLRPLLAFGREISLGSQGNSPAQSNEGHREILEAIAAANPREARSAMARHLSWTAHLRYTGPMESRPLVAPRSGSPRRPRNHPR
jgi:GntR family transcriptional repressor for pyruvate dehydrogenase complex